MSIEETIINYKETNNDKYFSIILKYYSNLINSIISKYMSYDRKDDLFNFSCYILYKCLTKFDLLQEKPFHHYLIKSLKNEIKKYLSKNSNYLSVNTPTNNFFNQFQNNNNYERVQSENDICEFTFIDDRYLNLETPDKVYENYICKQHIEQITNVILNEKERQIYIEYFENNNTKLKIYNIMNINRNQFDIIFNNMICNIKEYIKKHEIEEMMYSYLKKY